jgi:rubrerythrin
MELGTFGAILRFAMELETEAAQFYEAHPQGLPGERTGDSARAARKRLRRLEQARREGVSEMILEAIVGLNREDYRVELGAQTEGGPASLQQALSLEDTSARFYRDAASKMPIRGVARLFDRLAREHEHQSSQLQATAAEGTQRATGASAG